MSTENSVSAIGFMLRLRRDFDKHDIYYKSVHGFVYAEINGEAFKEVMSDFGDEDFRHYVSFPRGEWSDITGVNWRFMNVPVRINDSVPKGSYRFLFTLVANVSNDPWLSEVEGC